MKTTVENMKTRFRFRKYKLMGISLFLIGLPLLGQTTGIVDLLDTINGRNTPDVFYKGVDEHVKIFYFDLAWHYADVTAAAGAPNASLFSPLADLLDTINGTPDVFYLGWDSHVHILYFDDAWH